MWLASLRLANSSSLLQPAGELFRKYRRITNRKLAAELSVSKGGVNFRMFNTLCSLGSRKLNCHIPCAERRMFSLAVPLRVWWWKLFLAGSLWGWNVGPSLWTAHKRWSVELHHSNSSCKKMSEATLSARKVMVTVFFFGCRRDFLFDIVRHVQTMNSDLCILTLRTLEKRFRRVGRHKYCWSLSARQRRPHTFENSGSNQNSDGLFLYKTCSLSLEP